MRRIIFALAFCLLPAFTLAQTVTTDEPAPLTLHQLVSAQRETQQRLTLLSYRLDYSTHTLDDEGQITGSQKGTWDVLRLERDVQVKKVAETRSTLKHTRVSGRHLANFVRSMPVLFSEGCPVRLVRHERRENSFALLYRALYTGTGTCFDGLVWVDEQGSVLEAEGRFEPARQFCDGELVWPRFRLKMKGGLPETIEGEDLLTFYSQRDKNGEPLRVRIKLRVAFSNYRRPQTGEPSVTLGDFIEP